MPMIRICFLADSIYRSMDNERHNFVSFLISYVPPPIAAATTPNRILFANYTSTVKNAAAAPPRVSFFLFFLLRSFRDRCHNKNYFVLEEPCAYNPLLLTSLP